MFGGKYCIRAIFIFISKKIFKTIFPFCYVPTTHHGYIIFLATQIQFPRVIINFPSCPMPPHSYSYPWAHASDYFCLCNFICSCHYHYLPGPGLTISYLPHVVFLYYLPRLPPVNTAWKRGILPQSLPTPILLLTVIYFFYNLSIKREYL